MDTERKDVEPTFFDPGCKIKLPVEGRRNVLITSALPYVNNVPHLGNIIGSVLSADVFARYCRLRGYQYLFVCGTDEYGTATEMKALSEGVSPRELCDKFHRLHKQIYDWFNIDFDHFGRTTTEHQTEIAQKMFLQVYKNGFTSVETQNQLYCGNCKKFLADRFVNGICPHCKFDDARGDQCDGCGRLLDGPELIEPKCLVCGNKPTLEESKHVFLDLNRLTPQLEAYLEETLNSDTCHWSSSAVTITRSWLKMGLEKRCITRDLQWGTPVPLKEFASKVFYVWFDAPIGYLSITKSLLGDQWTRWWKNPANVELYNFLGKDNVAFHSIIFPATQIATKDVFTCVKQICATEYLNYEDQKFSKSRGIGVFGDAVSKIGIPADVLRFYLLYMRPEGQDTSFCWDDLMLKVNSELLANLGNFILRALSFLANNFGGVQPPIESTPVEEELFAAVDQELAKYTKAMEEVRMRDALQLILSISRRGNQYMQTGQPWVLVKGSEEDRRRAGTIIGTSANIAVLLSVLLYPYMPSISAQIQEQCNIPKNVALPTRFIFFLKHGHKHNKPFALFNKLEPAKVAEFKSLFGGAKPKVENGEKQSSPKKKPKKTDSKNSVMEPNGSDVNQLYEEVLKKFQKAREIFVANEMTKLDSECAELRKQIEQYKDALGFSGPLFAPQQKPPSTAAGQPANGGDQEQKNAAQSGQREPEQKKEKKQPAAAKGGAQPKTSTEEDSVDVGRLDLRVGRIVEAKKHPDADALYVEQIDLGEDKPRTVVSGLVRFVPLEQMQNRLVVCLCNLKPAKMRGVESQAMVMCASTPDKVELLEVDQSCRPGDLVVCASYQPRPDAVLNPKKKIWESVAPDLGVSADGECVYKGAVLKVERTRSSLKAPSLRNVPVK